MVSGKVYSKTLKKDTNKIQCDSTPRWHLSVEVNTCVHIIYEDICTCAKLHVHIYSQIQFQLLIRSENKSPFYGSFISMIHFTVLTASKYYIKSF